MLYNGGFERIPLQGVHQHHFTSQRWPPFSIMTTLHSLLCIALAWLSLSTNHCTAAPSRSSIKRATKLSDGVTCDFGTVYPFKTSSSALRFTVPFARAPIGALRFANPQNLTKLPQGFDATKLAASCMQDGSTTRGGNAPSEDCLYMT